MEGADAAIAAWNAGERDRILGQNLSEDKKKFHADLAMGAEGKELNAWKQFKVPKPQTKR